ncbi:MAG: hypothetical protein IPG50_26465 [Myxococcales bacterium]|nr:hypothetical protein [Myxococcales bacterium]
MKEVVERLCMARGARAVALFDDGGVVVTSAGDVQLLQTMSDVAASPEGTLVDVPGARLLVRRLPTGALVVASEPTADVADIRFHATAAVTSLRIRSSRPPAPLH